MKTKIIDTPVAKNTNDRHVDEAAQRTADEDVKAECWLDALGGQMTDKDTEHPTHSVVPYTPQIWVP